MQETVTAVAPIVEAASQGLWEHLVLEGEQAAERLVALFSEPVALIQFGAIGLALLLAALISHFLNSTIRIQIARLARNTLRGRLGRFFLSMLCNILFSVLAAVLLSGFVTVLSAMGILTVRGHFVFAQITYSILYAWALLSVILSLLAESIGRRYLGATVRRYITVVFWFLALLQIVGLLPRIVAVMQRIKLPVGTNSLTLWSALMGAFTVFICVCAANWLANTAEVAIMSSRSLESNLRLVFARICRVILMVLAVLFALSSVGIDLTILSLFSGALGVGIGFGMQKIASNYISGFIILFDRSIKLGDLVEVSGFSGVVTQINTRYSVLRSLSGEELIVPNETFVTSSVKNYTLSDRECVSTLDVSIGYDANADRALEILLEIVRQQKRLMPGRSPWAIITDFGADGVNLRTGFWVADPENGTGSIKSAIMREVLRRYAAENIEIPFAKRDVMLSGSIKINRE